MCSRKVPRWLASSGGHCAPPTPGYWAIHGAQCTFKRATIFRTSDKAVACSCFPRGTGIYSDPLERQRGKRGEKGGLYGFPWADVGLLTGLTAVLLSEVRLTPALQVDDALYHYCRTVFVGQSCLACRRAHGRKPRTGRTLYCGTRRDRRCAGEAANGLRCVRHVL